MMSKAKALELAGEIPFPAPGEIVQNVPVEVFCAFMELHNLKIREWRGGYVVLIHEVMTEEEKERNS